MKLLLNHHKCAKINCNNKASKILNRGTKRKPSWYCKLHFNQILIHKKKYKRNLIVKRKKENFEEYKNYNRQRYKKRVAKAKAKGIDLREIWRKEAINKRKNPKYIKRQKMLEKTNRLISYFRVSKIASCIKKIPIDRATEHEVRDLFENDCRNVGLQIKNEPGLLSSKKNKRHGGPDLFLPELNLWIESKHSSATCRPEKTRNQVIRYKKDLIYTAKIKNWNIKNHEIWDFSVDGSNSTLNLKQLYEEVLKRLIAYKQKNIKFKFLRSRDFVKLFKKRIKQLQKCERYFKNSPLFDDSEIRQAVRSKVLNK